MKETEYKTTIEVATILKKCLDSMIYTVKVESKISYYDISPRYCYFDIAIFQKVDGSDKLISIFEIKSMRFNPEFAYEQMQRTLESLQIKYGVVCSGINKCTLFVDNNVLHCTIFEVCDYLTGVKMPVGIQKENFLIDDTNLGYSLKSLYSKFKQDHNITQLGDANFDSFIDSLRQDDFIVENNEISFKPRKETDFFLNYLGKPKDKICRYSTLESSFIILRDGTHAMCNINCMNDPLETEYADNYIYGHKSQERPNISSETNSAFIISCSELRDDLTMWRLYGDNAQGCCVIYDLVEQTAPRFYTAKISYGSERRTHYELSFIKSLVVGNNTGKNLHFKFNQWDIWKHFFKPFEYKIEQEVRILYIDDGKNKAEEKWLIDKTNNVVCPMKIFRLSKKSFPLIISEVVLGCKVKQIRINIDQMDYLAKKRAVFKNIQIQSSSIEVYR